MNAPFVRNACPTLARPMQTGDGLLARLNPVAAGIAPQAMIGLAQAALRHGNGIMEVTQRGSLQLRGLTARSAAELAAEVDALGIAVRSGVPVETGPLAGLDPAGIADPRPLADATRRAIAKAGLAGRLGPKVSVVVDGGGAFDLKTVLADVRLTAVGAEGNAVWELAIAGNAASARPLGLFSASDACHAVLAVLEAIVDLGDRARARDLAGPGVAQVLGCLRQPLSGLPANSPTRGQSGRPERGARHQNSFDLVRLKDGRFALPICLPFGSIETDILIRFIRVLEQLCEIRPAARRRLLLFLPSEAAAMAAKQTAAEAGFITEASDPRLHIVACPGAPACGSGEIAARDIARDLIAGNRVPIPDIHISGCAKRCAAPRHNGLALIGEPGSALLVLDGGTPLPIARTPGRHAATATARVLELLAAERRASESGTSLLRRIGTHALASAFASEPCP